MSPAPLLDPYTNTGMGFLAVVHQELTWIPAIYPPFEVVVAT